MAVDIDTILTTVKEGLGVQVSDTTFDATLIMHINSVFMDLNLLGVGPDDVFVLSAAATELWSEFLEDGDDEAYASAKSYMLLRVQMLFDPSASAVVMNAMKDQIDRAEFRLESQVIDKTTT